MAEGFFDFLKNFLVAPNWYPAVPILGFIIIAAASVGLSTSEYGEEGPASGSGAWPAPMALSLGLLGAWVALGNYSDGSAPLIIYTVVATVCGILAANRGVVRKLLSNRNFVVSLVRDVVALTVGIFGAMLALELSWNTNFPALDPKCFLIELGLCAGIVLSLYFLGQRSASIIWPAVVLAAFAGTCQYFLAKFKGVAILPSDLLAMPTAFKVKEGYSFILDGRGLWGPMAACISFLAFSLVGDLPAPDEVPVFESRGLHSAQLVGGPEDRSRRGGKLKKALIVLAHLVIGCAIAGATCAAMVIPSYMHDFGVTLDYGKTLDSYKKDGFLTGFVAAAQDFPINPPKGYTRAKAAALQTELDDTYAAGTEAANWHVKAAEQFIANQPSIVVVLNESFADLSMFNGLGCDYKGPTYFKSIDDALVRGSLAVSVIGGGTCNTEFEVLTGNSYAFVGAGKYPFVTYQMKGDNLASQLETMGYTTHAIHPNLPTNWNRDEVYAAMGFDEFIDIAAFEEAPQLHMGATDAATYDKVLEILKLDPSPQFIFDVTMQNHGSYNLGNIPEDQQLTYKPEGMEDESVTQEDADNLNEYLACIEASDQDLKYFINELNKLDRRVVLVFLGDHQPAFTPLYNDLYFADEEDEVVHQERVYQTEYMIWANYDVAGVGQKSATENASADMLGAMTLNLIGAPLNSYQKARMVEREGIIALNAFGYLGADGVWYARTDEASPYAQNYQDMAMLNYLNFGSKVSPL